MLYVFLFLCLTIVSIFLAYAAYLLRVIVFETNKAKRYERLEQNLQILIRAREEAFRKVYYQDLIVYQASNRVLTKEDLDKFSTEFIKLTLDLCGPVVKDELISFFGLESLLIQLKNYFITEQSFLNLTKK